MRIPDHAHTTQPWRIHEFADDFRVEDVWVFRTPGAGPDDLPVMIRAVRTAAQQRRPPAVFRLLLAVRWKLGALFGWDRPQAGLDHRVASLRDRLPAELADREAEPFLDMFSGVYQLDREAAYELANRTVHDIMHLGWVATDDGGYELRLAGLVKPAGRFGRLYMAAIRPFRRLLVYPALTRLWERAWLDYGHPDRRGGG